MMAHLLSMLLALLAGSLITPALAPFNFWPLAWLPPALLYLLLRERSPRAGLWLGWCFGLGVFGAGTSWVFVSISEHSATPLPVALLLTGLFVAALAILFALQGWLFCRHFNRNGYAWLAFAGLWWLFEWLRSWLLTGFPWLYLGYASLDSPLANWAPLGGVWLSSLWIALGSCALAALFTPRSHGQRALALLLLAAPWLAAPLLPGHWTQPTGRPLQVALVQADIPQEIKWQSGALDTILQRYQQLSRAHLDVDLMIWPETAVPALYSRAAGLLGDWFEQLEQTHTTLISGLPAAVPDHDEPRDYRFHNSLAVLSGGAGIYHKQRLVPFGEYLPLEGLLRGLVDFFNLPASNFKLPQGEQRNLRVNGYRLASAICYEIAYPELVRHAARDSELLLTVSNDTWFGHSIAPDQHMQIARMRALENGRWLLRGTNNGITALVAPDGKIVEQAPRYQSAVLRGEVQPMQGETPYQRVGVWPVLILSLLLSACGLRRSRSSYSRQITVSS
ncbi:apolipoprotein N-acyltransferase [Marinobacterium arenosum]|uniref:apolipoprotein N-acyltransferase n=1 Tax=Marinobacterium arenosum TaxID=2862496 RepID=UPI001C96FCF1|nr:apolipoprotein N-acyltransferase [Marinobacterium arenosum]MBY4676226.1 apolipoprotein N-acyltransferase [Marinobacterium arenosum]